MLFILHLYRVSWTNIQYCVSIRFLLHKYKPKPDKCVEILHKKYFDIGLIEALQ